jgi:periplasmic copper chaperone A
MTLRFTLLAFAALLALGSAVPAMAHEGHTATDGTEHADHADCNVTKVGDLEISGAFTRATLPNAPVGGGFLTIKNMGASDDRLVSAVSTIAKDTQIHEMAMEGDVMKMRQLEDGLVIPAGETVTLEPGGYHIMFMGLSGAIAEGDKISVTLTFEKAGEVTVDLVAAGSAADAPAHDHSAM